MNEERGGGEDSGIENLSSDSVYIRVAIPDAKTQKCLQFHQTDTVWSVKQKVLTTMGKELKDGMNFGLYQPPMNGRAGKFLDEERLLRDYSLSGPIGFLEFKYKRRVYKLMHMNPRKLKQLHTKSNLKQFLEAVRTSNLEKINRFSIRGLDPNFHEHSTGETPLCIATGLQKPKEVMIALFSCGAHLDFRAKDGQTPMHRAAARGNVEAIKTLLDLGTSANYRDKWGLTPLYNTVCNNTSPLCVELLLHDHATIGTTDDQGWAEVHHACKSGCVQHLEHLLFYGADMNVQNHSGNTPLHVCAAYAQESCARVLLFRGADKSIQNYSNQDAYQLAIISANTELADIIRDFTPDQVVPFQEMPTYNDKRRGTPATVSTYGTLKRSRSDPRLNLSSSRSYNDLSSSSLYESPSPSTSSNHSENSRFLHHSHNHTTSPSLSSSSSHYQHHNNLNHQQQNQQHQNIYQNHNQTSSGDLASISTTSMRRHHSVDSDTSSRSISIASTTGSNSGVGAIRIGGYTTGSTSDGGEAGRGDSIVLTRATLAALVQADGENAPRKVVLAKSPQGFGFILRGAKSQVQRASVLEFQPSADFPALQYLESVDEGSMAHKAGLKRGDFILEINGENVMNATHEKTVRLIQETRDTLAMTVVTVRNPPTGDVTHMAGGVHQDGIRTLPHKKKGQFDLGGSTRSEQQRLNAAASRVGVDPNNKTASIKRFSKRITAVDLQDIITRQGSYEPELEKQHQQQSLSRARSQPNLNPEPQGTDVTDQRVTRQGDAAVYSNHIETSLPNGLARTGYVTSTVADVHQHQGARDNAEVVYAVPTKDQPQPDYIDTDSGHNSGSSGDSGNSGYGGLPPHPKYPAPTPPTSKLASSTKVPPPPAGPPPAPPRVPTSASSSSASSHMVQISTAAPSYANISAQLAQQKANGNGSFESSFRPGRDAKLSKEPVATPATASLRRVNRPDNKMSVADAVNMFESTTNSSTSISTSASSTTQGRRQSVSFDDDQMYENAARFAEETPNATVLITNEPEPDYEQNNGSNGFGDAIKMAAMAREQRTQDHSATRNVQETATKEPQDELTAAIARRRNQVERQDNVDVVDAIETRAQRNYNGVSNQNGTAHTGGGGGGSNRLGNISATSTSSISTQSSDAGSERYQRDGTPVRGGGHGDGGDEDNSNFRQMAERARQQWLQQKTNTQQTPPSQHRNNHVDNSSVHSNGHVRTNGLQQQQQQHAANGGIDYNVRSGNTNDVPPPHAPPPPPPPMPSYNQPPAAPPAPPPPPPDHAPPLPPNHPTLPSHNSSAGLRQSNHSSTNMPATSSQQQQILQQSADRKPGIADLAQVIAQKAKQRQAINDSTNGSLNAKLEKQGPAKTTILGQHLLHKSGNTNSNNKVYINGATVDYSSTENQVKSPNAMNGDHGTLNRDMAQLSMADKLKMFDTQQKALGKTGTSRHINGYSSTTATTSNVPPPMMSYNGYTTTHTNGNHNNEPPANWPITANGSNDYNHGYTINSKLAQHNHLVNTTAPGVGRAGNSQLADVIQVEAIPPPPLFTSMVPPAYDGAIAAQHAREETSSLVSSVSTLSTLSSVDPELASYHHQQDTIQEESYDSMIAPPPPPPTQFTADQLDFIPPPMGFDNSPPSTLNTNNSSSVAATFAAKPVSAWSVQDVCDWLRSLRQHQHVDMFSRHAINGTKLLQLQRPSLVRLGVIRPSDTIAIEQAIRQLKYQ